jgi:two-component system, chemotaxis family, sensor kinase CheA
MAHSDDLRQRIEDLALRVVMEEPAAAGQWAAELEQIRQLALRENSGPAAAAALVVLDEVRSGTADPGQVQQVLSRLQSALEERDDSDSRNPAADPELLTDFVLETREHLADVEAQTLALERNPADSEALHAAFRGFHSIKGLAGFLELGVVQEMAHEVEAVLDRARDGQLSISPAAIDVILQAADHLQRWTAHVEKRVAQQPAPAPAPDEALLARIRSLCETEQADEQCGGLTALASAVAAPPSAPPPSMEPTAPAPSGGGRTPAGAAPPPAPALQAEAKAAIKVDTAKLDSMVEMAGELVIAESLLRHDSELASLRSPALQRKVAQLTRITTELQKTAMAMRLVPVGPLFRRMARLVRDLARQFGKTVEMELVGSEIELDRTIVEELADPLMHMIRNALDHGIEEPAERERAGKPVAASVRLKAQHQAGQVLVEIADDGRGLNRDKILRKAMESGLVASGEGLADSDVYNLIFQPGFSTAAQVTSVSGRGVGMDVVRRHIEKLRGRIEIRSTPGKGSVFLIKLPLTLAIIDGLVVGVGAERYIVPLFAVREMFRPGEDVVWSIQRRAEMALVRGTLLPILRLHRAFCLDPRSERPQDGVLIVAEVEGERFCLLVDQLIGKQEVVIKSLGETFRNVPGIAGGAILGDGRVGLILDLERLFSGRYSDSGR